ncbi:serine/threonine protein kinase [Dictyobacter formicarum]|uniref:Protein kinase domain-containing protein n=1 Tax=Dictyobacter formicarum TaxID=2778368 RepID=A0ABQ3VR45_9CHLR|nr:serine/threonine-protein kinase [Dictyobacter formicarum]GHO88630.1 hypothetical protein KSZ_66360 [Dictyobacter formicarum]
MPFENMQFGHYKLLRQIGSGGMGEVYLAEDIRIARHVAIKIVRNEVSPYPNSSAAHEAARLFQREMKAISRLDHPHVLSLYDFGEETINGVLMSYMVMPFRPEGSLADWLAKREGSDLLSLEDVAFIVYQAADALQEAHNQQLIHQDIKPSNFLIRVRRDHPNRPDLLLADFGVSKLTTATATASQTVRGTPAYMSPEQWDGQPVPATDQYALAVMAYQLLTGYLPFQGSTMQVMRQHFTAQPKPPSALRPDIPVALADVVLRALAKQPEERFPSILEFAQAFQQAVHDPSSHSSTGVPTPPVSPSSPSLEPTILPQQQETVLPDKASQATDLPPTVAAPEPVEKEPDISPVSPKKTETPQKGGQRRMLIVALVIVLILTSIVGLGSYQIHVNTVNAQATADANSATAYAQYSHQATATAYARYQANATATFVAANPYPSYLPGTGTAIVSDPLDNPNNWREYYDTSFGGACMFKDGTFHVTLTPSHKTFSACQAKYSRGSSTLLRARNFAFEVQMNILEGNCGGILFRGSFSNFNREYMFEVCQGGYYSLNYWVDTHSLDAKTAVSTTFSSAIHSGLNQLNTIAVVANGSTISMYANQQQLTSVIDTNSDEEGWFALLASVNTTAGDVAYRNAKVWQL